MKRKGKITPNIRNRKNREKDEKENNCHSSIIYDHTAFTGCKLYMLFIAKLAVWKAAGNYSGNHRGKRATGKHF